MKNLRTSIPRILLPILFFLLWLPSPVLASVLKTGAYSPVVPAPFLQEATTEAPTPTQETSGSVIRPIVVLDNYRTDIGSVSAGQGFELLVKLNNAGREGEDMAYAKNIVITFTSSDFIMETTGGVVAVPEMDPGESRRVAQPMTATYAVVGKQFGLVTMDITYNDNEGIGYSQSFSLNIPITWGRPGTPASPTPTATVPPALRPQLVVTGYQIDVQTLQPGTQFNLDLQIHNVGNANARRVTMILGGGTSTGGPSANPSGTPEVGDQSGGISGGSGDFASFAPVAASNVQFLGDMPKGGSSSARVSLIVNSSTNPGAYPLKLSLTCMGDNNVIFTDDQVVTLLVYAPPLVEVNFYRDPGILMAGQPNQLPLQVVNLGRKSTVLGNMRVEAPQAELQNNTTLIGALDIGGYFTLDPMIIPQQPGPLDLMVTIDYTDDFNQSQVITRTIHVEVQEAPAMDPGVQPGMEPGVGPVEGKPGQEVLPGQEGLPPDMGQPETFWQKTVRFLKGLFGLDSGQQTPGEMPLEEIPPAESVPIAPGGGKG